MSIRLNNIKFEYDNFKVEANLEINDGEFLSILGPSGSGKTTILRLLAGFILPISGNITVGGVDITPLHVSARNIGMVFQDYALFPHLDVFHNICYGLNRKKFSRKEISERVLDLLSIVDLEGYQNRRIEELSGGEKQRVALARAIAPEPQLLLFDEPLSALDVKLRKKLRRDIVRIQKELKFTAVYVTHDQEEAMSISDRIAVMNNGKIRQIGSPEEIYKNPVDFFTADFIGTMNKIDDLMFRPEACKKSGFKNGNEITITVTIESSDYVGGYYVCEGDFHGNRIVFYNSTKLPRGCEIELSIDNLQIIR